jgi:hypothetical protein
MGMEKFAPTPQRTTRESRALQEMNRALHAVAAVIESPHQNPETRKSEIATVRRRLIEAHAFWVRVVMEEGAQ